MMKGIFIFLLILNSGFINNRFGRFKQKTGPGFIGYQ